MVRDTLSETNLPQPAVLVVGDDSSYFSSEVWTGVVEAARAEHQRQCEVTSEELDPILEADYENVHSRLKRLGLHWHRRPATRSAIPLQLSHPHGPDPGTLRRRLGQILDLFDVWAIVASASAGNVKPLREAIEGIDIPLLVTTDSTTVTASGQRPNELRLMPSNKAQATAMLFTAIRVNEADAELGGNSKGPLRPFPEIACSSESTPQARKYVNNLKEQLYKEAGRHKIQIEDFKKRPDNRGPVIVIGYSEHAESIIKTRLPERLTILSDGCATASVYEAVERERAGEAAYWYVSRPEVELREVGYTSYSAVQEAGSKLLTWNAGSTSDEDFPRTSLRDVIKKILSASNQLFTFDGIENVAPGYRVVPVLEGVDPGIAVPPPTPKPARRERHLSVVSS